MPAVFLIRGVRRSRRAAAPSVPRSAGSLRPCGPVRAEALVVHGEAGVGKTALLVFLAGQASGCWVERALGVQPEMELAFAGLHQLCAPMLDRVGRLPQPQRDALRTAFGMSSGPAPGRFLVDLAVLGLLSGVAGERPLICLVDDEQWLDHASAQALGSWRVGWGPNRPAWCSGPGFRPMTWPGCRSSKSGGCAGATRGRCWTWRWPGRSRRGSGTRSWPRGSCASRPGSLTMSPADRALASGTQRFFSLMGGSP